MPKYTSLPFFTMFIIHLHATHPDRNAATKPMARGSASTLPNAASPFAALMASSNASPRIGGMTMRNENCASFSFLLPSRSPVAMVLPERDSPGITAAACASPMMKASFMLIFSFCRGFA